MSTDTIAYIVNQFNFDRVEKVMIAIDWKWAKSDGLRVPTQDEMRDHCISLLINAEREQTTISAGGFKAIYKEDEYKKSLTLEFVVAWESARF